VALQNTNQSINTTGISGGTTKHKSINQIDLCFVVPPDIPVMLID
jgi:hypothetical protein